MTAATGLVLTVDCSTTASKAVVFDRAGRVVAAAARPLELSRPHPAWHEQDARQWWTATRDALREAIGAVQEPARIEAVCLTHQRESFVCLGADDVPLRPAVLWLDSRAGAEIAELGSARVHELSGKPPDTTPALYKLAWLRRHEPSVLASAQRVGDVHAYLTLRLTGRWVSSTASADSLGLFDLRARTWSAELLEAAGVRLEQMPALVPPGEPIAELDPDVARALGLPRPIPLIAGLGDGQAAGLGADVTGPGVGYLNLGTSMVMGVTSPEYLTDPAFRTLAAGVPGQYTLETVLNAASYLTSWFRQNFGDPDRAGAPDPALDAAAAAIPPGCEGLLTVPYWNCAQTPYWDPDARGATVGWQGRHTPAHLYRSILEGVGYELRLHLAGVEAAAGRRVELLRAMGGGSRSSLWVELIADITQRPVQLCDGAEISARGAAVLAVAATGDHP
ncbi:MAG TPA: FGGY family carbohydrate kinase, partial [Kineosporiaceae bacterium]|nr:FGGY family carbohydrate kinase [Kineosporiaceae bacterium]